MNDREALFARAAPGGDAVCLLCPHACVLQDGFTGLCGVRGNRGGRLTALSYARVSALALDPIEKKPLYRFRPGTTILSVGGFGCNMHCPFCQNHTISRAPFTEDARTLPPETLTKMACQAVPQGNIGAAYTYNEPSVNFEYIYDCARLIRRAGLFNVMVTNGLINREPLETLLPFMDAMNIDLKGFTDAFYHGLGGRLDTVKDTIALAAARCHVEVTTLVLPGENEAHIGAIAEWLASVDEHIPLHLSRFFPRYRYIDRLPTARESIIKLQRLAERHLKYVYAGNM
ncbi:MAG: AmmeMemoRadiSam system radical SAM enzyme [Clostridia bacterium]|nr:AmmeMemoRadiSam system radical SAM enzyme [Clostridia bacterium]